MNAAVPTPIASTASTLPRVLLLEDDPSVRRLVALALEDEALELVQCSTLQQAREVLQQATPRIALLLIDRTLPDGSGLALLDRSASHPDHAPVVVVFSGGIDPVMQRQLPLLGVWRILHKPVSIAALVQCTREALSLAPTVLASADTAPPPAPVPQLTRAIPAFFADKPALFATYRQSCLIQFVQDLAQGEHATAQGDVATLGRIAHNLKSVLTLLGHDDIAQQAQYTEALAHSAAPSDTLSAWKVLHAQVQQLR